MASKSSNMDFTLKLLQARKPLHDPISQFDYVSKRGSDQKLTQSDFFANDFSDFNHSMAMFNSPHENKNLPSDAEMKTDSIPTERLSMQPFYFNSTESRQFCTVRKLESSIE